MSMNKTKPAKVIEGGCTLRRLSLSVAKSKVFEKSA